MQIGLFLKQFQNIIHEKQASKTIICEVLFHYVQKEILLKDIKVSKGVLYINKDIFFKNAVLFKKEEILKDLNRHKEFFIKEIK